MISLLSNDLVKILFLFIHSFKYLLYRHKIFYFKGETPLLEISKYLKMKKFKLFEKLKFIKFNSN
jgi:hypothetical protein